VITGKGWIDINKKCILTANFASQPQENLFEQTNLLDLKSNKKRACPCGKTANVRF